MLKKIFNKPINNTKSKNTILCYELLFVKELLIKNRKEDAISYIEFLIGKY